MTDSGSYSLVADIGATHARFSLAQQGALTGQVLVLPTADQDDASNLLREARAALGADGLDGSCIAVAGPVLNDRVQVTNGGLLFQRRELERALASPVRLVNDFYALARALPTLGRLEQIGGDPARAAAHDVKVVLGPGSGLGMSLLVPEGADGWQVLPSEGGHADLAPGNHLEQELLSMLMLEHPVVCWETVLSGPGLVRLYRAVARLWGSEPGELSPEEISEQGRHAADPVCHQALEMFFGFLGAAAGNLALTVCARGGVYIGGGIVPALVDFARTSAMRRRFEERAELADFVTDIPLYLILDEHPGLAGAACLLDDA